MRSGCNYSKTTNTTALIGESFTSNPCDASTPRQVNWTQFQQVATEILTQKVNVTSKGVYALVLAYDTVPELWIYANKDKRKGQTITDKIQRYQAAAVIRTQRIWDSARKQKKGEKEGHNWLNRQREMNTNLKTSLWHSKKDEAVHRGFQNTPNNKWSSSSVHKKYCSRVYKSIRIQTGMTQRDWLINKTDTVCLMISLEVKCVIVYVCMCVFGAR